MCVCVENQHITLPLLYCCTPEVHHAADRGTTVAKGKWELRPATQNWVKDHDVKAPHVDYDISKIKIFDFVSSKYWAQRAEVSKNPEQFTRSGLSRQA